MLSIISQKVAAEKLFGSNLVLANREAQLAAPSGKDSLGQNQWATLRAAHEMASKKSKSQILVPGGGLEPPTLCSSDKCSNQLSYPGVIILIFNFTLYITVFE